MNKSNLKQLSQGAPDAMKHVEVLIVEDSAFERLRLAQIVNGFGHRTHEASNGEEALALMKTVSIDMIISDWSMPHMDGLSLCARVTADDRYGHPYFIMLTGRCQPGDLVQGMEAGADDFINKPASTEELRVRLNSGLRALALRRLLEQQNESITQTLERERMILQGLQQDIDAAAQMQLDYLPQEMSVEEMDYGYIYKPASGVSGDSLGLHPLGSNHIGFYLLDVSGQGIASGMHAMSIARRMTPFLKQDSLLYDEFDQIRAPDDVVRHLNEIYCSNDAAAYRVTLAYGVMDLKTGRGRICQAGPSQALLNAPGHDCVLLGESTVPIGVQAGAKYESSYFTLPSQGSLMLYSDGLIERDKASHKQDEYAVQMQEAFSQLDDLPAEQICRKLEAWVAKEPTDDDASALIIKRLSDD